MIIAYFPGEVNPFQTEFLDKDCRFSGLEVGNLGKVCVYQVLTGRPLVCGRSFRSP